MRALEIEHIYCKIMFVNTLKSNLVRLSETKRKMI